MDLELHLSIPARERLCKTLKNTTHAHAPIPNAARVERKTKI